jgi:hypothetical protein
VTLMPPPAGVSTPAGSSARPRRNGPAVRVVNRPPGSRKTAISRSPRVAAAISLQALPASLKISSRSANSSIAVPKRMMAASRSAASARRKRWVARTRPTITTSTMQGKVPTIGIGSGVGRSPGPTSQSSRAAVRPAA